MTDISKYRDDPSYRERVKKQAIAYYENNKEKIKQRRLNNKKDIPKKPKKNLFRSPVIINFFSISDYQSLLINHIISGTTEKIVGMFYEDTINYRDVYSYLPSRIFTDEYKVLRNEYKELKKGFSEEKPLLVIIKE